MSAADTAVQPSNRDAAQSSAWPAASANESSRGVDEFLIARGGPFYDLQQRIGMLQERALNAGRRAAILVGLAWGVPLVLSAVAGHAIGPAATRPFLLDLGAWARFFIAIGIFVLMERMVEERLRTHLRQLACAPLIAPGSQPAAAEAVLRALKRRDLPLAEMICAVAACTITLGCAWLALGADASSWLVTLGPEGARFTAAGWWCVLVSSRCSGSCSCAGCGGMRCGACCCGTWRSWISGWSRPIRMAPAGSPSSASIPTRSPPSCSR